jgi:hypothetical protein
MKRQISATRSFLHQLAEPIPQGFVALVPRRSPAERGAATRSSFDAIPPILDVTEATADVSSDERHREHTLPSMPQSLQTQTQRRQPAPPRQLVRASTTTGATLRPAQTTPTSMAPASHAADSAQQDPAQERADRYERSAMQSAPAASADETEEDNRHQPSIQLPRAKQVASTPFPIALSHSLHGSAQAERSPDIRVHIGTVEVRVPASQARSSQPTPANTRTAHHSAASSRAAEPLTRSLAWSHGLVQG